MQASDPWGIIEYEVKMFAAMYKVLCNPPAFARLPYALKNAVEESAVLHARILCEIFLSRAQHEPDNLPLSKLFLAMKGKLGTLYGTNKKKNTPCWAFNKMLAHATSHRGRKYDYRDILADLRPVIQEMIDEIECLRGVRFPLRFFGR